MADQFEHRYGGIAQLLHWLIAIMIFVMFALGWYMTDLETGAEKFALYQIHKGIGVTILAFAVLRLLWRLTHPAPPLPATMKGWERLAASGTHWVLYTLIFLQPLIGILQSNAANFPIVLWGSIQLPTLIGQDQAIEEKLVGLHHLFAKAMALLIMAHIGAAFRHHFMLKDDVLKRMLPNGAIAVGVAVLAIGLIGPFFVTPDEEPATAKVEVTGVANTDSSGDPTVSSEVANIAETAEADQPAASDPLEQVAAAEEDLPADAWIVDNGSVLGFLAFQQGSDVQGSFENFAAEIVFDVDDLANSRLLVDIDVTSITTGHGDRDKTLNSPSFFDTETWPRATFESKTITANDDGGFDVVADLTMRDVTKEVTLSFTLEITEDPDDPTRELAEAKGELPILRLDYGIGQGDWTSTTTVADEVMISIDIKASRAK